MASGIVDVRFDPGQIRALERDPGMDRYLLDAGRGLAGRAAAAAPKNTGAGAASIRPYPALDDPTAVDVSWDQTHFYMIFQEDGARGLPGHHMLRDAFEHYIHT